MHAHRHTHPKGVHTAGAVKPTRAPSNGAWGVLDLRSSIASLADENWWCRPVTPTHTGAGEPVEVYGAGVSGVTGLLLRAVRHEALLIRMEVRDLRRLAVVAAG